MWKSTLTFTVIQPCHFQTLKARLAMIEIVKNHMKRTGSHNSFTDLILHASQDRLPGTENISDEHGQSLFVEMLFGSNETTASVLCALVIRLSQNPDIVQRVRQEMARYSAEQGNSGNGGKLTYDGLKQMIYVNDVLKEVLRLNPPVAAGFRKAVKDFEIGVCTCAIYFTNLSILSIELNKHSVRSR